VDRDGKKRQGSCQGGYIREADKYLRVVFLPDGETVHNAFFDRNFKRRLKDESPVFS
jgi:hypothetical protein